MADKCRAIKRNGKRCNYKAPEGHGGFCRVHFPREPFPQIGGCSFWSSPKVETFLKIVAAASGLIAIADFIYRAAYRIKFYKPPLWRVGAFSVAREAGHIIDDIMETDTDSPAVFIKRQKNLSKKFDLWFEALPKSAQRLVFDVIEKANESDKDFSKVAQSHLKEIQKIMFGRIITYK